MNKNKSLKEAKSNRELFFFGLSFLNKENEYIKEDLYSLLIKANEFKDYSELVINFDNECKNKNLFIKFLKKYNKNIPIQYILNEANFLDFKLYINKHCLIPRMETQELVLLIIKKIEELNIKKDTIVDCCTGSGCIALALKKRFVESNLIASDIDIKAIKVARINANNLDLDITFLRGDKLKPLLNNNIKCDVFVSNPPYVKNIDDLEYSVKKYEPKIAIIDKTGLSFYEDFFKNHEKYLNTSFLMGFEINYDQEKDLTMLINKYFVELDVKYEFIKDSFSRTRFLLIYRGY